jgi:hypothetical protein
MTDKTIAAGVVHEVPEDLQEVLISNPDVLAKWNNLTPLARKDREIMFRSSRREAQTLLLVRLSSSMTKCKKVVED